MAGDMLDAGEQDAPRTVVLELSPKQESVDPMPDTREHDLASAEKSEVAPLSPAPEPAMPGAQPQETLYKCAICGDFVYESQLEHHVTVCPDPNESSPQPGEEEHLGTPGSPRHVQEESVPSDDLHADFIAEDVASEATQRMWKQWKQDSKLAAHHDAMVQRSTQKRNQLLDERRRKEDEECTFQPKTLPRGSPRTYSRPDTTGEGKWIQRWDERMRHQRLRQVEAQHYAELTLKPKISPYAHAYGQKQAEDIRSGQMPGSVFERLYQAALAREERKLVAVQESQASIEAFPDNVHSSRQSPTRRVPTSELLYSDALDRRERLRIMAEQLQMRQDEVSKEKRAVLNRSRRYYWQMLERQVKSSFEAASNNQPVLLQASLEDFLIDFKCMRPRKNTVLEPDSESSRLLAALWRHLDPNKTGYTDLLTMTVFFHVLMGAVDEAAQGAAAHSPGSPMDDQDGVSPATGSPGKLTSPRQGGGEGNLQPINEDSEATVDAPLLAMASAPADADDEGRRIVELLLRFDPSKLRSEFQPLYSHRIHYQSQQEKKQPPKEDEGVAANSNPNIDSQSRAMAAKLMQRQRGESGKATHAEILLWRHSKVEAKKEERRAQRKNEEVSGCTFRPKCIKSRVQETSVEVITPAGATRAEVLYARGLAEQERKAARALECQKAREGAEIRQCTFQPNVRKSLKSYHRAHELPSSVPRGFYESRQRLRAANEAREQTVHQREDRMAKIVPVTSSAMAMLGPAGGMPAPESPGTHLGGGNGSLHSALPTVAEDPVPSSRRRAVSPKSAWGTTGNCMRQRSASAGKPGRASPRTSGGQAFAPPARSTSQPPLSSMPCPEDPTASCASVSSSRAASGSEAATPAPVAQEPMDPAAPEVPTSEGPPQGSAAPREAPDAQESESPPLLYVDVNIAPGQPPERIVLREGQNVNEVAAEFAAKHVLTPVLAQRLHSLLREVVHRQEQTSKH
eukprot:TRINITY_DN16310_c0_g1_i1.p1 TRINITY_DN16310_c0_g1~~TRINITY_DN16310_c0_g1_i1.p1  ORF type:complete len:969 (+),score=182.25 TRINITY_DN16310_c0_g1_i1:63-2969(+)